MEAHVVTLQESRPSVAYGEVDGEGGGAPAVTHASGNQEVLLRLRLFYVFFYPAKGCRLPPIHGRFFFTMRNEVFALQNKQIKLRAFFLIKK